MILFDTSSYIMSARQQDERDYRKRYLHCERHTHMDSLLQYTHNYLPTQPSVPNSQKQPSNNILNTTHHFKAAETCRLLAAASFAKAAIDPLCIMTILDNSLPTLCVSIVRNSTATSESTP